MPLDSFDDSGHLYFITASVVEWYPLFDDERYTNVILDAFSVYRDRKDILLFAFVIMPSHIHFIAKPLKKTIGEFLQSFGSYTAHKLIGLLKEGKRMEVLSVLHEKRRDTRSNYSLWQELFTENIFTQKFLEQKLEYIHQNPVTKNAGAKDQRSDYLLSSAGYYDKGEKPIIAIDDIRDYLLK